MKLTGKLSAALLFSTLIAGGASAQIPTVVQHVQDKLNDVQQQKKAASDAALKNNSAAKPAAATAAKPTAATAVKPAVAVGQKAPAPVAKAATTKPTVTAAASKPAAPKPAAKAPASKPVTATAKPAIPAATTAAKGAAPGKADPFAKSAALKGANAKRADAKTSAKAAAVATATKAPVAPTAAAKPEDSTSGESKEEAADKKKESGYITAGNRRDPFVSPIVQHLGGSGCSTGKRCLAIDQIALRGIVKSDGGMIAVVVNSLDKAYFLRENDPVFNGYVLKISGDSVVFKETVQDKLGHLSTREVVKKITTPAV